MAMTNDDVIHDIGKTVDTEELLFSFVIEMPKEHTEAERAVKKGLSSLRKMRRTLTDLSHIRKEEKPHVVKPGEKAKEEAMQLLRSGAISLENKKERQTFKRKSKDLDEEDANTKSARQKDKQSLYGNFLRGPKLYPHYSSNREQRTIHAEDAKPVDSPDLISSSALFEAAASKRKQQLIALSEEESEDTELRFTTTVEHVTPSSPIDDNAGDHSNRPHGKTEGLPLETTLHVGYHNVSSSVIRDLFKSFGNITRIKISEQQSHAYVTMETHEMAEKALELDHQMVNNRLLRVSYARKQFTPRRCFGKKPGSFSPKSGLNRSGRFGPSANNSPTFHDPQSQSAHHDPSRDLITYEDLIDDE